MGTFGLVFLLAFTLMTTTVFAIFISFIDTALAVSIFAAWYAIDRLLRLVEGKLHGY